jgi:hypothetical protein
MPAPIFTLYDAQALMAILKAAEDHAIIRRTNHADVRLFTGQAKRIWQPISVELADLTGRTDVRELYLVVKLPGTSEMAYWPIGELIREHRAGTLAIG